MLYKVISTTAMVMIALIILWASMPASSEEGQTDDEPRTVQQPQLSPEQAAKYDVNVRISNRIPARMSRNMSSGLYFNDIKEKKFCVESGFSTVNPPPGVRISRKTRIDYVCVPPHMELVQVTMDYRAATDLLGAARVSQGVTPPRVKDDRGDWWHPIGYIIHKGGRHMMVRLDRVNRITQADMIPVSKMDPKNRLYLYFMIPRELNLTQLQVGGLRKDIDVQINPEPREYIYRR
jgi:hypothetical protein